MFSLNTDAQIPQPYIDNYRQMIMEIHRPMLDAFSEKKLNNYMHVLCP